MQKQTAVEGSNPDECSNLDKQDYLDWVLKKENIK